MQHVSLQFDERDRRCNHDEIARCFIPNIEFCVPCPDCRISEKSFGQLTLLCQQNDYRNKVVVATYQSPEEVPQSVPETSKLSPRGWRTVLISYRRDAGATYE